MCWIFPTISKFTSNSKLYKRFFSNQFSLEVFIYEAFFWKKKTFNPQSIESSKSQSITSRRINKKYSKVIFHHAKSTVKRSFYLKKIRYSQIKRVAKIIHIKSLSSSFHKIKSIGIFLLMCFHKSQKSGQWWWNSVRFTCSTWNISFLTITLIVDLISDAITVCDCNRSNGTNSFMSKSNVFECSIFFN